MKAPMNGGAGVITKYFTDRLSESFNDILELEKGYIFRMRDGKILIVSTNSNREYEFDSYLQKIIDCFDVCISNMNNYKKMEKVQLDFLFFPTCVYNYMYFIMHKEKRRIALSTYIRDMKKMIMNYSKTRYPEWNMLPQPKIELGLNNMMDAQFSNDIEKVKFTLKKDINSDESIFPGFHNPYNRKQDTYTSFTIDINTVDTDKKNLAMEHNKLLLWLEERYHANIVPLDMLKGTYIATDKQIPKMEFEIKRKGVNYELIIGDAKKYTLTSHEFDIFKRHIFNRNVFFKKNDERSFMTKKITSQKGQELIPGFFADNMMNSAVPPSDTNLSDTNLSDTNLSDTNLSDTNLSVENPSDTNLSVENPSVENPSVENPSVENPSVENPLNYDTNLSDTNPSVPSTNITSSQIKSQVPPSNKATLSTIISLNEYEGTIENLFSKIQTKIRQLNNSNKIMYREKAANLKTLLDNLKAKVDNVKSTATVDDIKSDIIGTRLLTFKNQNLMGGKSKRRSKKSKKSKKSKRR
jgi:hypothetical protein